MANAIPFVNQRLKHKKIVMFGKSYSPETQMVKEILKQYHHQLTDKWWTYVDIEKRSDCSNVEDYLLLLSGLNSRQVPLLFVRGRIIGGYYEIMRLHKEDRLHRLFTRFSLESDSEDEDEDVRQCRLRKHEVIVRVEELDETEVVVKVADWLEQEPANIVDYDAFSSTGELRSPPSELADINRLSIKRLIEEKYTKPRKRDDETDPEWMYVGGTQMHQTSVVRLGSKTSFIMKRNSPPNLSIDNQARLDALASVSYAGTPTVTNMSEDGDEVLTQIDPKSPGRVSFENNV